MNEPPLALTAELPGRMSVRTSADVERYLVRIIASTRRAQERIAALDISSLELFRLMKFGSVGFHPIDEREINLVEQINQTWSYIAALAAARLLLSLHEDAGGFELAPGAHAALDLDIMSGKRGLVGAEVFAAVTPNNNRKLKGDLDKLAKRDEVHRYVFFLSPKYPRNEHQSRLDPEPRDGGRRPIQVWSVNLD
jgi:hypothetical protein